MRIKENLELFILVSDKIRNNSKMRKIKLKILNEQLLKESKQLGNFENMLLSNMLKVMEKDRQFLAKVNASLSKTSKASYNTPKSAFDAHFKGLKGPIQHLKNKSIELTLIQTGILKSSPVKLKLAESSRSKPKKLKIIVENKKQLLNEDAGVVSVPVLFGAALLAFGGFIISKSPQIQRELADAGRKLNREIDFMALQLSSLIAATATGIYPTWTLPLPKPSTDSIPEPSTDPIPGDLPDRYVPRPVPAPVSQDIPAPKDTPVPKDTTPVPPTGGGEPPKEPRGPWWTEVLKFCFNGEQLAAILGSSLELKLLTSGKTIANTDAIRRIAKIPGQLLNKTAKLIGSQFNLKAIFCQTLFAVLAGGLIDFLRTIPPADWTNRNFEAQHLENNYAEYARTLGWKGAGGFAGAVVFIVVKFTLDLVGPQAEPEPGQVTGELYGTQVTKNFEDVLKTFKILPDYNPAEITLLKFYYTAMVKSGLAGDIADGAPITMQQLNKKFKDITKTKGGNIVKLKNDLIKSFFQLTISSVNESIRAINNAKGKAKGQALDNLKAILTKFDTGLNKVREELNSKIGTETQVPFVGEEGETYAGHLAKSIDRLRKPIQSVLKELNSINENNPKKLEQFYNKGYKIPEINETTTDGIIAALQGIKGPTPPPPKRKSTSFRVRPSNTDDANPNR